MSNDLVALKVLIVSDNGADLAALRDAAVKAPAIVEIAEIDRIGTAAPTCAIVSKGDVDVVFLDARMPQDECRTVLAAAHAIARPPIVISMGTADSAWSLGGGLPVNGLLATPVQPEEARTMLAGCVRARMRNRVLLVDGSSTVRSVIRKVLQSCSYRFDVEDAADGVTALQKADKERFDVVLLDCNMPGIDSFTTLAMFQQSHASTKVVMITATNNSKAADKARASGAHDVLYKPFYAKDVDAVMNRLYGLMRPKTR